MSVRTSSCIHSIFTLFIYLFCVSSPLPSTQLQRDLRTRHLLPFSQHMVPNVYTENIQNSFNSFKHGKIESQYIFESSESDGISSTDALREAMNDLEHLYSLKESDEPPPPGIPPLPPLPTPEKLTIDPNINNLPPPLPYVIPPGIQKLPQNVPYPSTNMLNDVIPIYIYLETLYCYAFFLEIAGLLYFGYSMFMPPTGDARSHKYFFMTTYIAAALVFPFANLISPSITVAISILSVIAAAVYLFNSEYETQLYYFHVSMSIILGGVTYSFLTFVTNVMNFPTWYGLGGISTFILESAIVRQLSIWLSLALFAWFVYYIIMKITGKDIRSILKNPKNRQKSSKFYVFLESLTLSFPIVSGLSILFFMCNMITSSPIDLLGLFTFPTSFRVTEFKCYFFLILWSLLTAIAYSYGWTKQTVNEFERLETMLTRVEEWRLASEGRLFIGSDHISDSLTSLSTTP